MNSANLKTTIPPTRPELPGLNRPDVESAGDTSDSSAGRPRWYKLPAAIARDPELRPTSKIVWAILADRQGDNGHCWPSVRRIAQDAGLTVGAAHRAVVELERTRRVSIDHDQRPNSYCVLETEAMFQGRNIDHVPSTEHGVPLVERRCSTGGIKPDPRTRSKNQSKGTPCPHHRRRSENRNTEAGLIYQAYPRKVGKDAALKAIEKALRRITEQRPSVDDPGAWLLGRVKTFAASAAGRAGVYTPHPATWFNQGRYDDDDAEWNRNDRPSHPVRPSAEKGALYDQLG